MAMALTYEWTKFSNGSGGNNCVEVKLMESTAEFPAVVLVRNSNNPDGPVVSFSPEEWESFIQGAKLGRFDLPA